MTPKRTGKLSISNRWFYGKGSPHQAPAATADLALRGPVGVIAWGCNDRRRPNDAAIAAPSMRTERWRRDLVMHLEGVGFRARLGLLNSAKSERRDKTSICNGHARPVPGLEVPRFATVRRRLRRTIPPPWVNCTKPPADFYRPILTPMMDRAPREEAVRAALTCAGLSLVGAALSTGPFTEDDG
jgi:hypothetical protein